MHGDHIFLDPLQTMPILLQVVTFFIEVPERKGKIFPHQPFTFRPVLDAQRQKGKYSLFYRMSKEVGE